jgi:tetratricopeptide (TPR) repeat protein
VDQKFFSLQRPRTDDGRFIVFSGGKFEYRKGQDIVIAAMRTFMNRHQNVWLACAWHNQLPHSIKTMEQSTLIDFRYKDVSPETLYLETLSRNGIDLSRVVLYPVMNNSELIVPYTESDIGFFPNRCEGGNNMVMCEYMSSGRTVIASPLTGHADVITSENSFCLNKQKPVLPVINGLPTGVWFESSVDEAMELLEQAYERKELRYYKSKKAAEDMQHLTWQRAAQQFHAIAVNLAKAYDKQMQSRAYFCRHDTAEALFNTGDFGGAEKSYRELLIEAPLDSRLLNSLGTVLDRLGRHQEALAHYHKALLLNPLLVVARYNMANTLRRIGDEEGALDMLRCSTKQAPEFIEAWKSLGMIHISRDNLVEAADCFKRIVELEPRDSENRISLGIVCFELGRVDEAACCFEKVLAVQPDHLRALESLGMALHELDQLDRAEDCFRKVLAREPGNISVLNNLGTVLRSKACPEDAIAVFDRALSIDPDNGQVCFNRAMARLAIGEMPQAWPDYEARFRTRMPTRLYHTEFPRWGGESLDGRSLLVQSEQGFGDTFQFARYLPLLSGLGGSIVFECQDRSINEALVGLEGIRIVSRGESLPLVDCQIPLASLPMVFGTSIASIPFAGGYLKPAINRLAAWKDRLMPGDDRLKVGLVWGGNKYSLNANRSMQLEELKPLFEVPEVCLFSLQVGEDVRQITEYSGKIFNLGKNIKDFGDTSAIIAQLDLVVTIDTAVAHLAGALGVPTWVMLKYSPDWRWFLNRTDSPWYSSFRLFRQKQPGNWLSVVTEVAVSLENKICKKKFKVSG